MFGCCLVWGFIFWLQIKEWRRLFCGCTVCNGYGKVCRYVYGKDISQWLKIQNWDDMKKCLQLLIFLYCWLKVQFLHFFLWCFCLFKFSWTCLGGFSYCLSLGQNYSAAQQMKFSLTYITCLGFKIQMNKGYIFNQEAVRSRIYIQLL